MKMLDIPMSGRRGAHVFYMRGRTLCRRLYVVPRNVRTAARRRTRGAFGAIAKAWAKRLTEEQRQAWIVAGAKVESHPRLWQSGPLSGEMHFEGINAARWQIGAKMLPWPPEPVVFSPSPVESLAILSIDGQIRLRLRVSGPVAEDIMVFGQAPCSVGWKKWRHGAYLGLLPAPQGDECDITDMFVQRYGEPEPGKKVFIRTRQQRDGWEGWDHDLSEVVPVGQVAAARLATPELRKPKSEARKKSECRNPKAACWRGVRGRLGWTGCPADTGMADRGGIAAWSLEPLKGVHEGAILDRPGILWANPSISVSCAMHKGVLPEQHRITSQATPMQHPRGTGYSRGVRAAGRLRRLGLLAETRRKGHCRELWRGS
jgi:hypothetical protein